MKVKEVPLLKENLLPGEFASPIYERSPKEEMCIVLPVVLTMQYPWQLHLRVYI